MDNQEIKSVPELLPHMVELLNLTGHKEEAVLYVLTKEDEERVISNEIESLKKYYAWRLANSGFNQNEIMLKILEKNWDEMIDRDATLKKANIAKEQELWHKGQREKEKQEAANRIEQLKKRCTATYMFNLMSLVSREVYGKKLFVNDWNKHFITTLCFFFSRDPRFESELKYSFNKGLLIRGISGLGKTHLVKCLEHNELNPVHILSMIEITDEIKMNGEYEIDLGQKKIIYLDDVGTEEPAVKHYGTTITFFKNFIEMCYLKNTSFGKLMISTNCSFSDIENKYGFRVRSRMKDMFNVVDVKGEDMRG